MKKPAGISKEEWAKYKGAIELSLKAMNQSLDLIAEANFRAGEINERQRIIKLLELEIARHFELGLEASAYYLEGLVELIKGEQK